MEQVSKQVPVTAVASKGHTVVVGFNNQVPTLLKYLHKTSRVGGGPGAVLLSDSEMYVPGSLIGPS
eukprot:1184372-Prorocentrum_minimum.AAC.3